MKRLIFIDDDPFFHVIVQKILNPHKMNGDVMYCYDGRSVINMLLNNIENEDLLPESIFVDLNMPGFSGWDFLDFYKDIRSSITKKINIYVVSSSVSPVNIQRAYTYTFLSNYIIKPLTKRSLEALLNLS